LVVESACTVRKLDALADERAIGRSKLMPMIMANGISVMRAERSALTGSTQHARNEGEQLEKAGKNTRIVT
jgi:hypothetical protein